MTNFAANIDYHISKIPLLQPCLQHAKSHAEAAMPREACVKDSAVYFHVVVGQLTQVRPKSNVQAMDTGPN